MAKFMVLYSSSASASDLMATATPEQMQASMSEWMQWKGKAEEQVKVEFGMPLQAVSHVDSSGASDIPNEVSGYSMIEGDRDVIIELLKLHPHLNREGASIDLLELLSMPGM